MGELIAVAGMGIFGFIMGSLFSFDLKEPKINDLPLQKQVCVVVKNIGPDQTLCPGECFDWRGLHICHVPKKLEKE